MVDVVRLVAVVAFVSVAGSANAQECATAAAPACGGSCPTASVCDAHDEGTGVVSCECVPGGELAVKKLQIKLNFKKPALDSIQLSGTLPTPPDFDPTGRTVVVDVGGVVKSFTLDDKGKAKTDTEQVKVGKSKDGASKYAVKFAKGSFQSSLADEGLENVTVKDAPVTIETEVTLDGGFRRKLVPQTYTAKQGSTGRTK